jgi:hypothetical protein
MKKFLLLLVAVVLAGGLVLSCSQPSSYEITLKAGSAEGVAPDSIKVEAINGSNLITWKGTSDTKEDYTVYRKTIIDGEIDEGTIKVIATSANVTPIKGIAYASDSNIDADIQYVYGVVSKGFKEGSADAVTISDLVWQNEPEGGYVKAKKPAAGTELPAAPAVTATIVRVNAEKPGASGMTDVADQAVITLKGITPGYTYRVGIATTNYTYYGLQQATLATINEVNWGAWDSADTSNSSELDTRWIQINSDVNVFDIEKYLDYGDTLELSPVSLQIYDYSTAAETFDNWKGRLYVRIGSGVNGVTYPRTGPEYTTNGTRFYTNEVKLLDIAVK